MGTSPTFPSHVQPDSTDQLALNPDSGPIGTPVPCRHCSYILKGLAPEGNCPECGTPIENSLRSDLLRFADPAWLRQLVLGSNLLIADVLLSIVLGLAGVFVFRMLGVASSMIVGFIIGLSTSILWLVAVHLFTTPDPAASAPERILNAPVLARAGAWCGVAGSIVGILQRSQFPNDLLLTLVMIGLQIVSTIGFIALFVCAYRIAMRIPDTRLMKHIRIVGTAYAILNSLAVIAFAVAGLWMLVAMNTPTGPNIAPASTTTGIAAVALAILAPAACVWGVAILVFGIWAIVLLFNLRSALDEQGNIARLLWSKPEHVAMP